jgi:hypothetical protein
MAFSLRQTLITGVVVGALTFAGFSGTALASPSPTGSPGQPGAPGTTCGSPNATMTPGGAASAAGSPFNATGTAGTVYAGNPGTASLAHAQSTHAVSQYDVACFQTTSNPGHS